MFYLLELSGILSDTINTGSHKLCMPNDQFRISASELQEIMAESGDIFRPS